MLSESIKKRWLQRLELPEVEKVLQRLEEVKKVMVVAAGAPL